MKKIISLLSVLLIAGVIHAQILDTVVVRNLTLQAQDWSWFVGKNASNTDSVTISAIRRIRAKVQEAIPPTWTTNMTVDSLPGSVVVGMYQQLNTAASAEIAPRYTAIKNAISGKVNLAYWVGFIDAQGPAEFDRKKNIGKNVLIDQ